VTDCLCAHPLSLVSDFCGRNAGSRIEALTNVKLDEVDTPRSVGEKTVMVRAARQLLSAITKVLILADRVIIKQLVTAKDQVIAHYYI